MPYPCYDPRMRFGLIFVLLAASLPALAQTQPSQEVLSQRKELVDELRTAPRWDVAQARWVCINGLESDRVREARADGLDFTPDASDSCVAALERDARDGQMIYIYQKFLTKIGGSPANAHTLPKAIGNAALSGNGKVYIGNNLATAVTPQMAFDAGFTVAFMESAAKKTMAADKLKAAAEACAAGKQDAGTCFSVGYVYGSQAVSAR